MHHITANVFQTYLHNFCQIRITHLEDWVSYPSKQGVVNNYSHEAYHCQSSICSFCNKPVPIWPFKISPCIWFLIFWKWSLFRSIFLIKIIITVRVIAFAWKTFFKFKSTKINRENAVLTKIRKVRCPKGRSTALFACQNFFF